MRHALDDDELLPLIGVGFPFDDSTELVIELKLQLEYWIFDQLMQLGKPESRF